jgi:hypothetical protein
MVPHVISHKLICESQCTMTKLNYEILLTSKLLNNYIDYCLTTSSYMFNKVCIYYWPTKNMGLTWDPMKTPIVSISPSWCTLKKIAIGYNWTKKDIHVMWQAGMISSCMDFLDICHGSWHICKVNFVDSTITTCEICDIYWLQFFFNITNWS